MTRDRPREIADFSQVTVRSDPACVRAHLGSARASEGFALFGRLPCESPVKTHLAERDDYNDWKPRSKLDREFCRGSGTQEGEMQMVKKLLALLSWRRNPFVQSVACFDESARDQEPAASIGLIGSVEARISHDE